MIGETDGRRESSTNYRLITLTGNAHTETLLDPLDYGFGTSVTDFRSDFFVVI